LVGSLASPCAKVCNSDAPPTKIRSNSSTMKRHNSILTRGASIENSEQTASRWILLSILKVLCIFIAIHVTYFCPWEGVKSALRGELLEVQNVAIRRLSTDAAVVELSRHAELYHASSYQNAQFPLVNGRHPLGVSELPTHYGLILYRERTILFDGFQFCMCCIMSGAGFTPGRSHRVPAEGATKLSFNIRTLVVLMFIQTHTPGCGFSQSHY
jgi:hypothetical protein